MDVLGGGGDGAVSVVRAEVSYVDAEKPVSSKR
jgi:hypothetical protein